jgi:ribonuclease-3
MPLAATMTSSVSSEAIQDVLQYRFRSQALLDEALTHKSHVNERRSASRKHNERLEFLGDAVLSLIVSDYLAMALPDSTEGALSKLKAKVVSETSLAKAARRVELGKLLRLGRGEELSKGREKTSLLADALEAIIAAVYLDGGFDACRSFTLRVLGPELDVIEEQKVRPGLDDYKTQLQEWCQKHHNTLPHYETVQETGPDHHKMFEVELTIKGSVMGVGRGHSKKEAEQRAAQQALEQVGA